MSDEVKKPAGKTAKAKATEGGGGRVETYKARGPKGIVTVTRNIDTGETTVTK